TTLRHTKQAAAPQAEKRDYEASNFVCQALIKTRKNKPLQHPRKPLRSALKHTGLRLCYSNQAIQPLLNRLIG
ncbi:MAG TPA: hypothetical protein VK026_02625, partial [Paenalcaligenes sp.]|nr:hypothetical protein [Paenalcaligenes sp.]